MGVHSRDIVDVNFNIGGKRVRMMIEREQVRALIDALRSLEQTVAGDGD